MGKGLCYCKDSNLAKRSLNQSAKIQMQTHVKITPTRTQTVPKPKRSGLDDLERSTTTHSQRNSNDDQWKTLGEKTDRNYSRELVNLFVLPLLIVYGWMNDSSLLDIFFLNYRFLKININWFKLWYKLKYPFKLF